MGDGQVNRARENVKPSFSSGIFRFFFGVDCTFEFPKFLEKLGTVSEKNREPEPQTLSFGVITERNRHASRNGESREQLGRAVGVTAEHFAKKRYRLHADRRRLFFDGLFLTRSRGRLLISSAEKKHHFLDGD